MLRTVRPNKRIADILRWEGIVIDPLGALMAVLAFNFYIDGNLFEQIAKSRAGRRVWARMLKEEYNCQNPRSMWMRMIAGGGGGGLTVEQPENNIARGAYYAYVRKIHK